VQDFYDDRAGAEAALVRGAEHRGQNLLRDGAARGPIAAARQLAGHDGRA